MTKLMVSDFVAIDMSAEDIRNLENKMAEAHRLLSHAAEEKYGEPRVLKLRDDFKAYQKQQTFSSRDFLWNHPPAQRAMEWMIAHEEQIIAAFIRCSNKLCQSFCRSNISIHDCYQEASLAIYDAMYMFDGSNKFSTYSHYTVRNRLIQFMRQEGRGHGVTKSVQSLRNKVRQMMNEQFCSADEAIAQLDLTPIMEKRVRDSLFSVSRIENDVEISFRLWENRDSGNDDWIDWVKNAVEVANLSEMERNLVFAEVDGNSREYRQLLMTTVNPNTGRPWTRQRISQIYLEAIDKIRVAYEEIRKAA